jgi:hypothetical protein
MATKWKCQHCGSGPHETKNEAHACCPEKRAGEAPTKTGGAAAPAAPEALAWTLSTLELR